MIKTALILTLFTVFRINASEFYPEQNDFLAPEQSSQKINLVEDKAKNDEEDAEINDLNSSFLAETFNTRLQLSSKIHTTPRTKDDSDSESVWSDVGPISDYLTPHLDDLAIEGSFASVLQYLTNEEYEKALPLLNEWASLKNRDAQWELGLCYFHGRGVKANHEKSLYYFQMAADQGHILAQEALVVPLHPHDALRLGVTTKTEENV